MLRYLLEAWQINCQAFQKHFHTIWVMPGVLAKIMKTVSCYGGRNWVLSLELYNGIHTLINCLSKEFDYLFYYYDYKMFFFFKFGIWKKIKWEKRLQTLFESMWVENLFVTKIMETSYFGFNWLKNVGESNWYSFCIKWNWIYKKKINKQTKKKENMNRYWRKCKIGVRREVKIRRKKKKERKEKRKWCNWGNIRKKERKKEKKERKNKQTNKQANKQKKITKTNKKK